MVKKLGGEEWLATLREMKDPEKAREELIQLQGVGRKVADCVMLFSLDFDAQVPVDTHVLQLSQKMGIVTKSQKLNPALYEKINSEWVKLYGPKAGWAHQILFAGDLK